MRYRLRTLLIVITAACVYLAWASYCWRMARFSREHSSQFLLQVAKEDGRTREWAEDKLTDLYRRFPAQAAKMNDAEFVRDEGWNPVYASAVVNENMARKYDRAAWNPWVLTSD